MTSNSTWGSPETDAEIAQRRPIVALQEKPVAEFLLGVQCCAKVLTSSGGCNVEDSYKNHGSRPLRLSWGVAGIAGTYCWAPAPETQKLGDEKLGDGLEVHRGNFSDGRIRRHELHLKITLYDIFLLESELWDAWPE